MSRYEVGAAASFRATHVMPVEGPEGRPHPHDYRVEVVATRARLDDRGMVVDLDVLRDVITRTIAPIRDGDLTTIGPQGEGVTVEVLARWIHDRVAEPLAGEGADAVSVRVWESETEFAGYAADVRPVSR